MAVRHMGIQPRSPRADTSRTSRVGCMPMATTATTRWRGRAAIVHRRSSMSPAWRM